MKSYTVLQEENKLLREQLETCKINCRYRKEQIIKLQKIISEKESYSLELLGFIWENSSCPELTDEQKAQYIKEVRKAEDIRNEQRIKDLMSKGSN